MIFTDEANATVATDANATYEDGMRSIDQDLTKPSTCDEVSGGQGHRGRADSIDGEDKGQKLARILRRFGTVILVVSAISFAGQRAYDLDSLGRYWCFLGFTVTLSMAGVFCIMRLRDDKGARTLFSLAAGFLPAHFLYLGACLFASFKGSPLGAHHWSTVPAPATLALGATLAMAAPLLAAIAYGGFSALYRSESRKLVGLYLLGNILLLLPVRDPNWIGLIVVGLLGLILWCDWERLFRPTRTVTFDEGVASGMLYVPVAALILRNAVLYPNTELFMSAIFAVGAILFFSVFPALVNKATAADDNTASTIVGLAELSGGLLAAKAWVSFVQGAFNNADIGWLYAVYNSVLRDIHPLFSGVPLVLIIFAMSFRACQTGGIFRAGAAVCAVLTIASQLILVSSFVSTTASLVVSVTIAVVAFAVESKWLLGAGVVCAGVSLLRHLIHAVLAYHIAPWLSLAVVGVGIVILSSYIQKNYTSLIARCKEVSSRVYGWE